MTDRQTDKKYSLTQVYEEIKNLLYIEDSKILDVILSIMLSREQTHSKLWIIIIGRSGDGKSELLKLLEDKKNTYVLKTLTKNTFVNGKKDKTRYPDLAPELRNKVLLIPEMAQILTLHQDEKANIFGQLRDLWDGIAGKNSAEATTNYEDLNVSLIACSTPAIDNQVLIHQSLGTRELLYRTEDKNEEKLMGKVVENSNENKTEKRKKTKEVISEFLKSREYKNSEIKPKILNKLKLWAQTTTKLRAPANIDYSTGELTNFIYPEQPTRILEELITLYRSLKSLDDNYADSKALRIIKKIVLSTCSPLRLKTLLYLLKLGTRTNKKNVGDALGIHKKTAYTELLTLAQLGICIKEEENIQALDSQQERYFYMFKINEENEIVKHLSKEYDLTETRKEEPIETFNNEGY